MPRKTKRTAGERRYRQQVRLTDQKQREKDSVRWHLEELQKDMQKANAEDKQRRQMDIMQRVTEAIERLK
jgi:hypothetical protein